jgi:hypothetical protein
MDGTDIQTKKSLHAAQVERDLHALYILVADRDLFRDSVEDHLTDDIYTIRQWVLLHSQIIHRSPRGETPFHSNHQTTPQVLPSIEIRQTQTKVL